MFEDRWLLLVSAAAGFSATLALAGGQSGTAHNESDLQAVTRVRIADLTFRPETITVTRGAPVDLVNDDFVDHTATGDTGKWDVVIPAGSVARTTFETPGTYAYYCRYHPGMKGTVRVTGD